MILGDCIEITYHVGNPLSCVHSSMPHYALLRALATAAPNMDTENVTALYRLSGGDDL